jgi:hypothetical protein
MMRDDGPRQGWLWSLLRRIGFDRNPLRRGTDWIQAVTRVGLLVVFLVCAPLATLSVSRGIFASGLRAGQAQASAWHPVSAVVLPVTPEMAGWSRSLGPFALLTVRWANPGGTVQTGKIIVAAKAAAGSTMTVWINGKGRLAHPPVSRAEVSSEVLSAALATPVAVALLLAAMGRLVSLLLDKHRLARWEADWSAVEPRWTHRR